MKRAVLVAGIVVALFIGGGIGFHLGFNACSQIRNQLAAQSANKTEIIAAMRDLPAGTVLAKSDLAICSSSGDTITIPVERCVLPNEVDAVLGKPILCDVKRGDPICRTYVASVGSQKLETQENQPRTERDSVPAAR